MIQAHSPSKQNYVTVLAIYDDPVPRNARQTTYKNVNASAKKLQIQVNKTAHETLQIMEMELKKDNHCVEVKNFSQFPSSGLQVQTEQKSKQPQKSSTQNFDEITPNVHFAPEQEKVKNNGCEQNWRQNNARKSRISDTFLDAKERIDNYEKNQWSKLFHPENYRFERIILSVETCDSPMGIEISAVPNPDRPSHLLAVEVRTIEQKGRIAQDGRLRVGDQIVDINGMPCEQISFARARLHFRELQFFPEPSISFFRKLNQNKNAPTNLQQTEQLHALQKGNTSKIGQCTKIKLIRGKDGFGFNYAGRMNAKKEYLYYVKGLRLEQGLAVGDRILRIDGIDLSSLGQADVTALFKSKQIGEAITLLISRTEEMDSLENDKTKQEGGNEGKENFQEEDELEKELAKKIFDDLELLRFEIPLNETPGAGLGISVKAQRKASTDMGLYIRSILHGSAAYRDGRLRINDRLVGVEAVNLFKYPSNGEALDTFMRTLTQLPHGKSTVRVYVARAKNSSVELQRWGSDSELSQSEGFIRDSTARRSISEKRPLGLHNDPAHLKTYQRIVHQRQTSAPALSTVARARRSLHEPATLNNGNARANDGIEQKTAKNRPKSTFYTNEDVGYSNTLPSPKSHQIHDDGPPASGINSLQQIGPSKSQPESLAFLTRSGTVPVQNGEDGAIRQSSKRRSSLGSGLLKLFGRSKEEPRQMHQHRPPPPPYHQHWPPHSQPPYHHLQQYYPQQPSSTSTNHLHHLHPSPSSPQSHSSSLYSPGPEFFRHPRPQFHGPGLVEVPHWPHGDEDLSRRRRLNPQQWQPAIFKPTITSHSMFGFRAGHPPAAFSPPVSDHFHWQHSLLARPDNQNKIGKAQPSAVFYDDSGSHWVIRC